jgi:hypothetical protein
MSNLEKALRRTALAVMLTATVSNAQNPAPAPAPDPNRRLCNAINYVGGQAANPFTARRVTKGTTISPEGIQKPFERVELAARDSAGRIRFERNGFVLTPESGDESVVLHTRDGGKIETTRKTLGMLVMIFDCPGGTKIQLQPGMQIARVTKQAPGVSPNGSARPYSAIVTQLLTGKPQPNILVEDLGSREIEGLSARGVRLTIRGTESDGEWNGKPIRITETWASDDIAATILEIRADPKTHMEDINTLTDIKRVEPDPSLFEIPQGYKINPTADEMPYQVADAASTETKAKK